MTTIELRDRNHLRLVEEPGCRRMLEQDILPRYVASQRWYAAKENGVPQVRIETSIPVGPSGIVLVLTVKSEREARYFLPVCSVWDQPSEGMPVIATLHAGSSSGALIDAFADDAFVRNLLNNICTENEQAADQLIFKRSPSFHPPLRLVNDARLRRPDVEQSNTSIIAGPTILKAFRKLEAGVHPEVEIGAYLTDSAGFRNVPRLLGTVSCTGAENEPVVLCVLQELIDDSVDGWRVVTHALSRITEKSTLEESTNLLSLARKLGLRTAELHRAFAAGVEPAFVPEPVSRQWLTQWSHDLEESVQAAYSSLEGIQANGGDQEPKCLAEVLSRREDLICRIHDLMPRDTTAFRTRIHGDFHLGQTLVKQGDVFIVDFEGEPMRTLAERRAKYLPMRDAAGMLRSIDYAYATEIRRREFGANGEPSFLWKLADDMKSAFLEWYRSGMAGCHGFPDDLNQANDILKLGLIEKALYEISYEVANRPDWVEIPVDALVVLLNDELAGFESEKPAA